MNRILVTLFALVVALSPSCASRRQDDIRLEITSNARTLRIMDSTNVQMRIVGPAVRKMIRDCKEIVSIDSFDESGDFFKEPDFLFEFSFEPEKLGANTIGPYTLSFNGHELTSNEISIQVLPRWEGKLGTFFRVDRDTITLGEDVEFVMETWSRERYDYNYTPKYEGGFHCYFESSSHREALEDSDGSIHYARELWHIIPENAGQFRITKDTFARFPDNVDPPNLTVMVKQPAQPGAPADANKRRR